MAGAGYRDWAPGNVPTAAQFDTYLQEQTVMVFATAAARDSALSTAKSEGMVTYQLDTNTLTVYSGAAWSTVGPVQGALLPWTPVVVQGATPTLTNTASTYSRVGRQITGSFDVVLTSGGTAANMVTVSLPVAAAFFSGHVIGAGYLNDVSSSFWATIIVMNSSTTMRFFNTNTTASGTNSVVGTGANSFVAALASGDILSGVFSYEAAAD